MFKQSKHSFPLKTKAWKYLFMVQKYSFEQALSGLIWTQLKLQRVYRLVLILCDMCVMLDKFKVEFLLIS